MAKPKSYYVNLARQAALANGLDADIFQRQIQQESGFQPRIGSSAGAQGIAQIMPDTARGWGVNPNDPAAALNAAAKHMAGYVKSYGSYKNALVAYNAGPSRVGRPLYPETANYIKTILGNSNPRGLGARTTAHSSTPVATPSNGIDPALLSFIFQGSPMAGMDFSSLTQPAAAARPKPMQGMTPMTPAFKSGGSTLTQLQALGAKFGLVNDPGNGQTTGGKHAPGSYHYSGRAVDYGNGRNSDAKLRELAGYAFAHPKLFKELFYAPTGQYIKNGVVHKGAGAEGHGDHLHMAY